ncbi:MAG: hypothetical protein D4R65_12995 [Verrucomicrobiaceae bacterium]|nr:MAG: hypothetical protein D4R65_12995 [Verrucomicrobiaceae bacterium]
MPKNDKSKAASSPRIKHPSGDPDQLYYPWPANIFPADFHGLPGPRALVPSGLRLKKCGLFAMLACQIAGTLANLDAL